MSVRHGVGKLKGDMVWKLKVRRTTEVEEPGGGRAELDVYRGEQVQPRAVLRQAWRLGCIHAAV
jgi:hypothetical protein